MADVHEQRERLQRRSASDLVAALHLSEVHPRNAKTTGSVSCQQSGGGDILNQKLEMLID